MKRFASLFLAVLLFCLSAVTVFADDKKICKIDEPELTFTVPSWMYVLTEKNRDGDIELWHHKMTRKQMLQMFKEENMYCMVTSADKKINIQCTVLYNTPEAADYRIMSDEALNDITYNNLKQSAENAGKTFCYSYVYHHPQVKFVKTYVKEDFKSETEHLIQYRTNYVDKTYIFNARYYIPSNDTEQALKLEIFNGRMDEIIDSMVFEKSNESASINSPSYKTEETDNASNNTTVQLPNSVAENTTEKPKEENIQPAKSKTKIKSEGSKYSEAVNAVNDVLLQMSEGTYSPNSDTHTTYHIDEGGFSITLPNEFAVVTRDTPAGSSDFGKVGITYNDFWELANEDNAFLLSGNEKMFCNVVVCVNDLIEKTHDTNFFSNIQLQVEAETIAKYWEEQGYDVKFTAFHEHPQSNFIKVYTGRTQKEGRFAGSYSNYIDYATVYNGKEVRVIAMFFGDFLTADENRVNDIVNSIRFDAEQIVPEATPALEYVDDEKGITVTLPKNWFVDYESENVATFGSNLKMGNYISFVFDDCWTEEAKYENKAVFRSQVDNNYLQLTQEKLQEINEKSMKQK
ncbi:MAG: hypothetical protein IKV41_00175 [Oscillospiraceae bacterium]|nr:hypothetical protein [Oscillospiraceae bacterium]